MATKNTGIENTGYWNSGNGNSGNGNSGNWNSGYWNSGYGNSGSFNRDTPKMRLFEKDLDMTVEDFNNKYDISMDLPLNVWVGKSNMTAEEKKQNNSWETTGGFLRTLDYKDAHRKWWADNPDNHERFLTLPGFDWEIFTEITGIEPDNKKKTITIDGIDYDKDEVEKRLKDIKPL